MSGGWEEGRAENRPLANEGGDMGVWAQLQVTR